MKKIRQNAVPIQTQKDAQSNTIHWIWVNDGGFPRPKLDDYQRMEYHPQAIPIFLEALNEAEERIWLMDPHFDHTFGLSAIWLGLCITGAKDIRVISHKEKPVDWIREKGKQGYPMKVELEWHKGLTQLHDRFAIVDNEFWHFGSTVGGGYPGFGAATSGWNAEDLLFIFESNWRI